MLKGFKEFIMRGSLVELAVAFVIGAAFAAVVTAFAGILTDIIGAIGGQPDFSSVDIGGVNIGVFLNALVSFVIIAAVIYFFVVTPYNNLQARMAKGDEAAPPSPDIALLTEIRDLLAGQRGDTNVTGGGGLG